MTPLALPGRWRTSTSPATVTRRVGGKLRQPRGRHDAAAVERRAQQRQRMALQRQAERRVIRPPPARPAPSPASAASGAASSAEPGEERQRVVGEARHRPQRLAPVEPERAEGVGARRAVSSAPRFSAGAAHELAGRAIGRRARRDQTLGIRLRQPPHLAQAEAASAPPAPPRRLERAVPVAVH